MSCVRCQLSCVTCCMLQLLRFGNNSDLKEDTIYFTDNMKEIIDQFETVKDLGVVMNDQATFKNRIEKALSKARQNIQIKK